MAYKFAITLQYKLFKKKKKSGKGYKVKNLISARIGYIVAVKLVKTASKQVTG